MRQGFWTRLMASAVWVNLPVAWMLATGRLSYLPGVLYAGLSGAVFLMVWDGLRRRAQAPAALSPDFAMVPVTRTVTAGVSLQQVAS